jgi:hypothetical protein
MERSHEVVNVDAQKLKVLVPIFGRGTPSRWPSAGLSTVAENRPGRLSDLRLWHRDGGVGGSAELDPLSQ